MNVLMTVGVGDFIKWRVMEKVHIYSAQKNKVFTILLLGSPLLFFLYSGYLIYFWGMYFYSIYGTGATQSGN
jgi:uncharacterized membrane protein YhfC